MSPEDYTDENICQVMGLPGFELAEESTGIRMLCKPSFHPEVCLTASPSELQVVALQSQFWREGRFCRLSRTMETVSLASEEFKALVGQFQQAYTKKPERIGMLDGMPISILYQEGPQRFSIGGHPMTDVTDSFTAQLLELAHSRVTNRVVRNALAECGRYVNLFLAYEPEPQQPLTHLLILGTPEEREELLKALP